MKDRDLEKIKKIIWDSLSDITTAMEKIWGDRLLSIFVAGSTAHDDFKTNQDVDLIIIVKGPLAGENLAKNKKDLTALVIDGKIGDGIATAVPPEMTRAFRRIENKYQDHETKLITKFVVGPYFPKPIKKLTVHFHAHAPMSREFFQIYADLLPFHTLTMLHNCRVLYGQPPTELIKVKTTKKFLRIWLNNSKKRILKAEDVLDKEPRQALLIICKSILQISMNTLAYSGYYEDSGRKVIKMIKEKINVPLNSLPALAYRIKKHPEKIFNHPEKIRRLSHDAIAFADSIKKYFSISK